jgi:hypothetical protein
MKTHPLNVSYLVVGLVFLGVSGSWALRASGAVDGTDTRWMVPAVLLLAGVVGLVAAAAKGLSRSRSDDDDDAPAYDPYPATYDSGLEPAYDEPTDPTTRIDTDIDTDTTDPEGESR